MGRALDHVREQAARGDPELEALIPFLSLLLNINIAVGPQEQNDRGPDAKD